MADAGRHPNIRILSNSEVVEIEGEPGNYTVTILRWPRYVDESKCTGCRTCESFCPEVMPNPFDEYLGTTKAIGVWCPQAVPAKAYIEREKCIYFLGKCTICEAVCKNKAIDFKQKRVRGKVRVGAIIIATGYEVFKPEGGTYGYGVFENVFTSLEYERVLSASGPTQGEILRRTDKKVPNKIAWIQCVGSRDLRNGRSYCSATCCGYAIKQAIVTKNHHPHIETVIFHNDIRTFGKGLEDLYERAKRMGVKFIRGRSPLIKENPENHNLIVTYLSDGKLRQEEFEMVILSVGVLPQRTNRKMSELFGLELNHHGFFEVSPFYPLKDGKRGIFVSGNTIAPMDIPDTICSTSAVAAQVAELLAPARGSLAVKKEYPPERPVGDEEPRIGVFVCHCGSNIAEIVDVKEVVQYVKTLKGVVYAEDQVVSCSNEGLTRITQLIKEHSLNRVVVAACTPRTHEPVFREALKEAGLNPYLLEMVNIREHCSWVHPFEKEEATQKAKELLRMAIWRARELEPLQEPHFGVTKSALVLGGGLAGMVAALSLARQGFEVYLVEKEKELGGNLREIYFTLEGEEVGAFLKRLINEVEAEERIKVFKGYKLSSLSGYVGNFISTIESSEGEKIELSHGVVIIATGGKPLKPTEYEYGKSERILTQRELEGKIARGELPEKLKTVVMIQCVQARDEERPYCSRICCGQAIKNSLKLKESFPDVQIMVFYRDMRTYGFIEDLYREARGKGVLFIRYDLEKKPQVELNHDKLKVKAWEPVLKREIEVEADLVVLSVPVDSRENLELSQQLGLPLSSDGFFMEAHIKLRPVDFTVDGFFLCGMAHYPKFIPETIAQAKSAALRAALILSQDQLKGSGVVCEVREDLCMGCGACVEVCSYRALQLVEVKKELKKAQCNAVLCRGDGLCSSVCPTGAIRLRHFTEEQILSEIDGLMEEGLQS